MSPHSTHLTTVVSKRDTATRTQPLVRIEPTAEYCGTSCSRT